jgi:hypothetical protein
MALVAQGDAAKEHGHEDIIILENLRPRIQTQSFYDIGNQTVISSIQMSHLADDGS